MVDTINAVNEASAATVETTESDSKTLFDIDDGEDGENQQEAQDVQEQKEPINAANKGSSEPSQWFYDDKIKGEGMPPEWFNHKTFKNITEQARAYNEARKQITQYSEKLKAFSGAPEKYEDVEGEKEGTKNNTFAVGLKELGQKIGLNQSGFNDLLDIYNKTQEIEAEKGKNNLLVQQKEELKKIGGVSKLKEIETKFVDAFGDDSIPWLKKSLKSYDDYVSLDRIISGVSAKTRLPVNSMESSISTREQAEELIRDPRWGKDREFTKKADKLLSYMLQGKHA
jgi:hypothetical protein